MKRNSLYILIFLVALTACGRTKPQSPSQRNSKRVEHVDSATLALMNLNSQMAERADREVLGFIREQKETYAQMECGCWMHVIERSNDERDIQAGEELTLSLIISDLRGTMLLDQQLTTTTGHEEIPLAIRTALAELHRGDKAKLACPWYTAYGMKGNEYIAGYKNVIIELTIQE